MGGLVSTGSGKEVKEARVLMVGLDTVGKSVLLYRLLLGEVVAPIPTIGFNMETVTHSGLSMTIWDAGGIAKIRPLWRHYFHQTDALVFVIDSSDAERFEGEGNVYYELNRLMQEEQLKEAVVLILANKQDLPGALTAHEITEELRLKTLMSSRVWNIFGCSALSGRGVDEAFAWLAQTLRSRAQR